MDVTDGARAERFGMLYGAHFSAVLAFALRRAATPEDAADIVAETFLVAWRRLEEVPLGGDARPWLYGAARKLLANQRRGAGRRDRLGDRLRRELPTVVPGHADRLAAVAPVGAALGRMRPLDREVLELTLWEGLEPREVALALGLTPGAVRTRLNRARARIRAELGGADGDDDPGAGHVLGDHHPDPDRKGAPQ